MEQYHRSEKVAMLKYLGVIYRRELAKKKFPDLQIQEDEPSYATHELYDDIHRILTTLPAIYVQIIKNDFLLPKEANWWQEYYGKKTYEDLKNIAIEVFFHCLYV